MLFRSSPTTTPEEVHMPEPQTAADHAAAIQRKAATEARRHGRGEPFTVTHDTHGISRLAVLAEIDSFLQYYADHGAIVAYQLDSRPVGDNEYAFISS